MLRGRASSFSRHFIVFAFSPHPPGRIGASVLLFPKSRHGGTAESGQTGAQGIFFDFTRDLCRRVWILLSCPNGNSGRNASPLLSCAVICSPWWKVCAALLLPACPERGRERPLARRLAVLPARLYQWAISPLLPPSCRFTPTCSEYAIEAILTHGLIRGGWLAVWRLLRCNPWTAGGTIPSRRPAFRPLLLARPGALPRAGRRVEPFHRHRSHRIIMEDKRTIIAIVLSIVVLIGWTHLAEYMGWVQPRTQEARQEAAPSPRPRPRRLFPPLRRRPRPCSLRLRAEVKVETPLYSAVIYTGAAFCAPSRSRTTKAIFSPTRPWSTWFPPMRR